MIAVDTNVLVYAHREETAQSARAREWLRSLAEGPAPWAIPLFCIAEFVRVVTHPRLFNPPTDVTTALRAIDALVRSPSLRVLLPGARFLPVFQEVLRSGDVRGNLVFDAHIAALCREHGIERLLTDDRDFARFPFLEPVRLDAALPS